MKFYLYLLLQLGLYTGYAQTKIEGDIRNEKKQPLSGVTVHLLNTDLYTASNAQGQFQLNASTGAEGVLELSAVGYASKLVSYKQGSELHIVLKTTSTELDEAVVVAEKKETRLRDLPISVTSLNAREINQFRLWNSKELTAIVPNLFASDPGDKRNVVSLRGITTSSYDPAVITYIDGVAQFGLDTYIAQLFDVERIEVLRGPQGTLYGRNAMGGVINIITRKPANKTTGFAEISLGDYGLQRYSAGVQLPLIKDKLFLKAGGLFEKSNGFYTNDFNNSHYDKQQAFSGNYSLEYRPTDRWRFSLDAKQQNNRNKGAFPLVMGKEDAFANPYHLNQNAGTKLIDDIWNLSLTARYTTPKLQLSSQTAYQQNYRIYEKPIDADFSPLDGITIINNYGRRWNNVKVYTQEFRVQSTDAPGSKFKWTAGSFLFLQEAPNKQATHFGEDGELVGGGGKNFSLLNTSTGRNRGLAIYGQASYRFLPRWELTAGLRLDLESRELSVRGDYLSDPDPNPVFAYQGDTSARVKFHALSPKLNLAYHLNAQQMLFAGYSKGFRTGGLTPLSADPSQPALYPYQPEYSHNIEAGWKWQDPKNKWLFNITAFYGIVNDVQVPTLVLPDAVTITRNTGKLQSKGIEAELQAKPVKGFDIRYSFGYTDAAYDQLKVASNGGEEDLGGKKQIFTPDVNSMLALQYRYAFKQDWALVLRGEWKYLGRQYFDLANQLEQSPYHVLNARFGVEKGKLSLMGWVRNLTDTRYIGYAYDFGAVNLAPPRTVGLTLATRF